MVYVFIHVVLGRLCDFVVQLLPTLPPTLPPTTLTVSEMATYCTPYDYKNIQDVINKV